MLGCLTTSQHCLLTYVQLWAFSTLTSTIQIFVISETFIVIHENKVCEIVGWLSRITFDLENPWKPCEFISVLKTILSPVISISNLEATAQVFALSIYLLQSWENYYLSLNAIIKKRGQKYHIDLLWWFNKIIHWRWLSLWKLNKTKGLRKSRGTFLWVCIW